MEEFLYQSSDVLGKYQGSCRLLDITDMWQAKHLAHIVLPDESLRHFVAGLEIPDVGWTGELA
jgi:hypothetical protein